MSLTRRDLLKMSALAGGAMLLPLERTVSAVIPNRIATSLLPKPFTTAFAKPPVLSPVRSDATTDYYQLTMRPSTVQVIPGFQTTIWGYEGIFPGPTLDVQRGRPTVVRQINELPATHPTLGYAVNTSVHLHGSASQPQFDGYADDVTYPQYYKDYQYPNFQDGRTLWYHDHGVHHTASNVYMGLAGMYRLHDDLEASLPIPKGEYDVPLIVSDAMFDTNGQLLYYDNDESGVYGDVIMVNGRPWPVMQVERRKYRFRILNASVSRSYQFSLDSGDPLVVIGTDGGLMPAPKSVNRLVHGNAERYEVVIDFAKYPIGKRVVLRNISPDNNIDYANTNKVMAFDVVSEPTSTANNEVPAQLFVGNPVMALTAAKATTTRVMSLVRSGGRWTINGQTWEDVVQSRYELALANPALNSVEVWEIRNDSGGWHHPLHIHLVDFRILDREFDQNGVKVAPRANERGPKDVVYVGENERVRVVARFGPNNGKYMVHCHNLVHEDHDMMGQFIVGTGGPDPINTAHCLQLPAPEL